MAAPTPLIVSRTHRSLHVCTLSGALCTTRPPPAALHWFPSGHLLAEVTQSGRLLFHPDNFSAPAGEVDLAQTTSTSPILCLSISTGSRFLALGRADGVVSVLDLVSKHPNISFSLGAPVVSIAFQRTSDSRYLACATAHSVSIFSRLSNRLVFRYFVSTADHASSFITSRDSRAWGSPTSAVKITAIAFSPQHRNLLVAADESGCVNVWDITKNVAPRPRTEPHLQTIEEKSATYSRFTSAMRTPATDMTFAPAGSAVSLCVGGFDKQLRFFDPTLKKFLFSITCAAPVSAVSFATDAQHLAMGLTSGTMAVWKIDAEKGSGSMVTQVCVDRAGDDGIEDKCEISAVRSVHFQPMDMYDTVAGKNLQPSRNVGKGSLRPLFLIGLSERESSSANVVNSEEPLRLLKGNSSRLDNGIDNDEEGLDLDVVGLDVAADEKGETRSGKMRHDGPRDSDIFSPVARRLSKKHVSGSGNVPSKASSFHETPRNERRANITFRTPRSRTAHTLIPAKKAHDSSLVRNDNSEHEIIHVPESEADQVRRRHLQQNGLTGPNSDSLDSISDKSSSKEAPLYTGQGDVSQLQGSTISEDGGRESRDCNSAQDPIRGKVPSSNSGAETEQLTLFEGEPQPLAHQPVELRTSLPRSSSDGGLLQKLSDVSNRTASSYATADREVAIEKSILRKEGIVSKSGANNDEGNREIPSPRSRLSGDLISHYQPTLYADGKIARGQLSGKGREEGATGLAEELRLVVAQELDLLRFELRKDIVNIHSEMIVMSAKQSQELKTAFVERDRRVKQLEQEVTRLKQENQRLKRKHGLGL